MGGWFLLNPHRRMKLAGVMVPASGIRRPDINKKYSSALLPWQPFSAASDLLTGETTNLGIPIRDKNGTSAFEPIMQSLSAAAWFRIASFIHLPYFKTTLLRPTFAALTRR